VSVDDAIEIGGHGDGNVPKHRLRRRGAHAFLTSGC
jgi:hypothetical protein